MVDIDSIKRASELVNSILFAKGFFENGSNKDRLLFKSIDDEQLQEIEQFQENDKLAINTIYALIQSFDKSKQERSFLLEQLNDKKEIISHYEASNRELNNKNDQLLRINHKQQNEIISLKQQLKNLRHEKSLNERNLQIERNINSSIKTKFEIEIKKKTILINQLQDKLLSRHKKFHNIIEGNNPSFTDKILANSNNSILDQELEKMMINLSNLITNLTLQNDQNIKFINYLTNYMDIMNGFLLRKLNNYQDSDQTSFVSLPPTPKFYYDNFQKSISNEQQQQNNNDISTKISHIIDFQKIQSVAFINLEKFYELMINEYSYPISSSNGRKATEGQKLMELEKELEDLNHNLNIAIETNDKWSKKYQELEKKISSNGK